MAHFYGGRSEAIRAVEAGQPAPAHDFDADRLIGRLHALGEPVGEQDEALRFLLAAMADGPRHGPPPEREAPDGLLAQQRLRTGRLYMQVGLWEHAGSILGTAMSVAPAELKAEVAAALEQAAPHAEIAAANLAMALLSADGVTCDAARAASLLDPLTTSHEPDLRAYAHNWLAHIALGRLGGSHDPAAALSHFEQAARLGHGEAAFNAGLMHDEGRGVPPSAGKARALYRRGVELGHPASMTNLAIKVMEQDFEEATTLLEQAAAAGDDKAAGVLQAWTEMDMAKAAGSDPDPDGDAPPPPPVCVGRPGRGGPRPSLRRCGRVRRPRPGKRRRSRLFCMGSAAGASWRGRRRRAGRTCRTRSATRPRSGAAGPTRRTCWTSAATRGRRQP